MATSVYQAAVGQGKYDFGVGNGSIELQPPADAQFAINATVGNGRIANEYPVTDTAARWARAQGHGWQRSASEHHRHRRQWQPRSAAQHISRRFSMKLLWGWRNFRHSAL